MGITIYILYASFVSWLMHGFWDLSEESVLLTDRNFTLESSSPFVCCFTNEIPEWRCYIVKALISSMVLISAAISCGVVWYQAPDVLGVVLVSEILARFRRWCRVATLLGCFTLWILAIALPAPGKAIDQFKEQSRVSLRSIEAIFISRLLAGFGTWFVIFCAVIVPTARKLVEHHTLPITKSSSSQMMVLQRTLLRSAALKRLSTNRLKVADSKLHINLERFFVFARHCQRVHGRTKPTKELDELIELSPEIGHENWSFLDHNQRLSV
eukprot:TRINITY_DN259761_c0_g1_i2.p1 TRINITY_DN259761_c0_g1~~TRINITY_DN259761_c0_g1_i2.p1  ORF type:complete len:269 (+),score=4.56 TRINITY_DN259761_c0_g1_i2:1-807(+)